MEIWADRTIHSWINVNGGVNNPLPGMCAIHLIQFCLAGQNIIKKVIGSVGVGHVVVSFRCMLCICSVSLGRACVVMLLEVTSVRPCSCTFCKSRLFRCKLSMQRR